MAFKFIIALACIAVASAGLIPTTQVVHAAQPVLAKSEESYDPHPQYQFSYSVNDAHTGDSKSQIETRDGDIVQGEYSLIDSDGHKRTVQYTADPVHGFNAVVNREPLGQVVKAVAAAPVAYAAPAVIKSAPLAYAAAAPAYTAQAAYTQTYAAAPALIKSSPLAYAAAPAYAAQAAYTQTYAAAPALIKSSPLAYAAAPAYAAHGAYTQTYAAAPALIKSAPLAYATQNAYTQSYAQPLVHSGPIAYSHAPAAYTTQTLVKSSPVAYTAPAYAYHH